MATITEIGEPKVYEWRRWPETELMIQRLLGLGLEGNAFARRLSDRLAGETGTRMVDWLDHLVVLGDASFVNEIKTLGYAREAVSHSVGVPVYGHDGGIFPRLAVGNRAGNKLGIENGRAGASVVEMAIKVESVPAFSRAHNLGLEVAGSPLGPFRIARVAGEETTLAVVERRGYRGFEPFPGDMAREGRMRPHAARDTLAARELWEGRQRRFGDDAEGFRMTEEILERVIELTGSTDLACHVIFEVERDYWQSRNRAARVQNERQDRLGLGWANHDHHTFRCSRRFFPRVMKIFTRLGFELRERFHAGAHAGWGAQILEHPVTGIVIFADLDLAPEEASEDFTQRSLPDLARPGTVGLWVALHGESILEAGMHHLEAQFDFGALKDGLEIEAGIETMKPFSDFPFLKQAFTAGERWRVNESRADRALNAGWIDAEQHARFVTQGAIGSHLENLERREGFKGFNQQAVSAIIAATDPRLH